MNLQPILTLIVPALLPLAAYAAPPPGLLTPDYGIVTRDDLAYDAALDGVTSYDPKGGLSSPHWQCVPASAASAKLKSWRGTDTGEDSNKLFNMCTVEIPLLAQSVRWMLTHTNGELRLKQRVNEMRPHYDVIVIDSCLGLGPILNSTLNTADRLIIPADTGFFGYMGIQELHNEIEEIRLGGNPGLSVLGYVLTMGERTVLTRETREALVKRYGDLVFNTIIRRCVPHI